MTTQTTTSSKRSDRAQAQNVLEELLAAGGHDILSSGNEAWFDYDAASAPGS